MSIDRRRFLTGGAAAAAGLVLGAGPFQGYLARAAAGVGQPVLPLPLVPTKDERDRVKRLAVPPRFRYRSFDSVPDGATFTGSSVRIPGNHDGMAAFDAGDGWTLLVRNHERNGSGGAFPDPAASTDPTPLYDSAAPGGNTYVRVDRFGNVDRSWAALRGTQMNCAGGAMPWGSWITCEETINGPDVFDDFTRGSTAPSTTYVQNRRLTQKHGYVFEVPATDAASAAPIRSAGRFAHEAAAWAGGSLYMTEDDFGFGSGFYRYDPPNDPGEDGFIADGGRLYMLGIKDSPKANLSGNQVDGTTYPVDWIEILVPDPVFPMSGDTPPIPTTTNNRAICAVAKQGWDDDDHGAAVFSRLEGCTYHGGLVYFTATQGGGDPEPVDWEQSAEPAGFGNGAGQVWAYDPLDDTLTVVYQSPSTDGLFLPDNVVMSPRGSLVICEDNPAVNTLHALRPNGDLIAIAEHLERPNVEFAGATFSPDGHTLFVNLNTSTAMTVAIWGPWHLIGV